MSTRCQLRGVFVGALIAALLSPAGARAQGQPRWLAAWTVSQNARQTMPELRTGAVRMIVRPAVSGSSVRVKLENTMGQAPVVFSAAFIGVAGEGAAVLPGSSTRLTFAGQNDLTLAPGAGAWSDPVTCEDIVFRLVPVAGRLVLLPVLRGPADAGPTLSPIHQGGVQT